MPHTPRGVTSFSKKVKRRKALDSMTKSLGWFFFLGWGCGSYGSEEFWKSLKQGGRCDQLCDLERQSGCRLGRGQKSGSRGPLRDFGGIQMTEEGGGLGRYLALG